MNKSALILSASILMLATVLGCTRTKSQSVHVLTEPIDSAAWQNSTWISAADAPVVTGKITGDNERAADGASWFLTTLKNPKEVKNAR